MEASATAAAAYFSTAASTTCFRSFSSDSVTAGISFLRPSPPSATLSLSRSPDSPFIGVFLGRRWLHKISSAVAQEEAVLQVEEEEEVKDDVSVNTKLYFGNLPYNCDSSQLAGIIQAYGSPEMVEVLYDRDTGRSRGFAFVTMSNIEDCNAVIENLDGSEYGGRTLRVNFSDKPKPKEPLYPETEFKLFVGNLSWSVTSESLNEVFQGYGNVVGARVLYDGDTGRSRGYGFVCYSNKDEMDAALEYLNGVEIDGRAMRVSPALGKRS